MDMDREQKTWSFQRLYIFTDSIWNASDRPANWVMSHSLLDLHIAPSSTNCQICDVNKMFS